MNPSNELLNKQCHTRIQLSAETFTKVHIIFVYFYLRHREIRNPWIYFPPDSPWNDLFVSEQNVMPTESYSNFKVLGCKFKRHLIWLYFKVFELSSSTKRFNQLLSSCFDRNKLERRYQIIFQYRNLIAFLWVCNFVHVKVQHKPIWVITHVINGCQMLHLGCIRPLSFTHRVLYSVIGITVLSLMLCLFFHDSLEFVFFIFFVLNLLFNVGKNDR